MGIISFNSHAVGMTVERLAVVPTAETISDFDNVEVKKSRVIKILRIEISHREN